MVYGREQMKDCSFNATSDSSGRIWMLPRSSACCARHHGGPDAPYLGRWIAELYSIDREGHPTRYALPGTESENRVLAMLQTADETVWVGTAGGLQKMKEGRFSQSPRTAYGGSCSDAVE